jgi:CBS-domain-containing membrane protein
MNAQVRDVMTKKVVSVKSGATFKSVVELLENHAVSALPVIDEAHHVVGIVSEADLMLKEEHPSGHRARYWQALLEASHNSGAVRLSNELKKARARTAAEMMTTPVVTIEPEASVGEAARLLHHKHVKRLPVTDATGRLIGIVSRGDLLKVFLSSDAALERKVRIVLTQHHAGDVHVSVQDGVVGLQGRLPSRAEEQELVQAVEGIAGVVSIDNDLRPRSEPLPTRRPHRPGYPSW